MSVTSTAPNTAKGARYLSSLDQALCKGEWSQVPELCRKVEKHAPERTCLTLAARTEAQVASSQDLPDPSTPSGQDAVSRLQQLASVEDRHPEDAYLTSVCVAGTYLLRNEYEGALRTLPRHSPSSNAVASRVIAVGWLEVAEVKATLFRLVALRELGRSTEARAIGLDAALKTPGSRTPELRLYTEILLNVVCELWSERATLLSVQDLSQSLRCFIAWSDFWQRAPQNVPSTTASSNTFAKYVNGAARRHIWHNYYNLLSTILQRGLLYNPSPSSPSDLLIDSAIVINDNDYTAAKSRQRVAMKQVEMRYESLLLHETQFPKASQSNVEVEQWIEEVIGNWHILNGPAWTGFELGDGGKEALSRGVLDMLYRAATKTFHSTPILRYLFKIHAVIGEFDLAMHAFDSYVEIVSKGKARAEKTGSHETGMDSEDTAVLTAAEAMRLLCRYGDRDQAEKALEVGSIIADWLAKAKPISPEDAKTNSDDNRIKEALEPSQSTESYLQPRTLAAAYTAIGIGQAQWSRFTYEADARTGLRDNALKNLRQAQLYEDTNIETAYALALLLAENRDVGGAIRVITAAITSSSPEDEGDDDENNTEYHTRERLLIPLWHLLGVCLTANDDYGAGMKMCEMAFEQFGEESLLFGLSRVEPAESKRRGVVELMDGFEKESLLQIRLSQLTLAELTEGADAALESSHELLSLYARLFGTPDLEAKAIQKPPPTAASAAPSKLGGTLRSIAGSIRPRSARTSVEKDPRVASHVSLPTGSKRETSNAPNGDSMGVPISITVTNEDGIATEKSHHHRRLPFRRKEHQFDRGQTVKKKRSFQLDNRPSTPIQQKAIREEAAALDDSPLSRSTGDQSAATPGPEQPLNKVAHNVPHDHWPPPPGHEQQPPRQDVRLPAPDPLSHLVPNVKARSARDRQQESSLLINIWLFIAGLYLRAELLDDAGNAVNEASKIVESFEKEVGAEHPSARRFYLKGWGGGKSVDNLWADIYCSRGRLALGRKLPFEALSFFEQALAHFPDHAGAIIELSNLLLDIYEETMPAEEPLPLLSSQTSPSNSAINAGIPPPPRPPYEVQNGTSQADEPNGIKEPSLPNSRRPPTRDITPAELNRLAARDRAYMLLSNLTKLGSGWDDSEAWYTLARAHELSKQISKAKQALWWVVQLEESQPMRPWKEVGGGGGFTLPDLRNLQ